MKNLRYLGYYICCCEQTFKQQGTALTHCQHEHPWDKKLKYKERNDWIRENEAWDEMLDIHAKQPEINPGVKKELDKHNK